MDKLHGTCVEHASLDVLQILSEHYEQRNFVITLCISSVRNIINAR